MAHVIYQALKDILTYFNQKDQTVIAIINLTKKAFDSIPYTVSIEWNLENQLSIF